MAQKGKRDWLEPPEWWKKWKPLRWIVGALLLVGVGSWIRALLPNHADEPAPAPVAVAQAPASVAPAVAPAAAPAPSSPATVPADTVPAPAPEPEPVAPPPPSPPTPAAVKPPTELNPPGTEPPTAGPPGSSTWEENAPEAADYTRVERDRLLMMDQFKSYDSIATIQAQLAQLSLEPVIKSTHRKVRGDAPPYDLDSAYLPAFPHLGVPGKLTLTFFNDRLFEVEFEPTDAETYLRELRKKLPYMRRGEAGRAEYLEGHLRLASSLDLAVSDVGKALRTRPYVLWQDRRLVRQRDEWDYKFARDAAE